MEIYALQKTFIPMLYKELFIKKTATQKQNTQNPPEYLAHFFCLFWAFFF